MLFLNDPPAPPVDDGDKDTWGGFRSGLRWHDETAPLGGGDKGPDPTPITNPND